eukprot:scaffold25_cov342-Pavlova_lutheri.AAC.45
MLLKCCLTFSSSSTFGFRFVSSFPRGVLSFPLVVPFRLRRSFPSPSSFSPSVRPHVTYPYHATTPAAANAAVPSTTFFPFLLVFRVCVFPPRGIPEPSFHPHRPIHATSARSLLRPIPTSHPHVLLSLVTHRFQYEDMVVHTRPTVPSVCPSHEMGPGMEGPPGVCSAPLGTPSPPG